MHNPTVLLVEDNPDDADLTRLGLEKSGIQMQIVHVNDGVQAIEYLLGSGANSYIHKSIDFKLFSESLRLMSMYWFTVSEAPPLGGSPNE